MIRKLSLHTCSWPLNSSTVTFQVMKFHGSEQRFSPQEKVSPLPAMGSLKVYTLSDYVKNISIIAGKIFIRPPKSFLVFKSPPILAQTNAVWVAVQDLHTKWIRGCVLFCVCLLSLSTVFERFIHDVTCTIIFVAG